MSNTYIEKTIEEFRKEFVRDTGTMRVIPYSSSAVPMADTIENFITRALTSQAQMMVDKAKKVTLTKAESTALFQDTLDSYKQMTDGWNYKAPEVIDAERKAFLWHLYIQGRINEKDDILASYKESGLTK